MLEYMTKGYIVIKKALVSSKYLSKILHASISKEHNIVLLFLYTHVSNISHLCSLSHLITYITCMHASSSLTLSGNQTDHTFELFQRRKAILYYFGLVNSKGFHFNSKEVQLYNIQK